MTDPLALLLIGLVVAGVCIAYWRVVAAVLAVLVLGVFAVGLITVVESIQQLTQ